MSYKPEDYANAMHKYSQYRLLSHTRDACEKFIYQNEQKHYKTELDALKERLKKSNNDEDEKAILSEIDRVKREFDKHSVHITINYSRSNRTARTVRKNNGFAIVIPTPDFESKESITTARSLIAHELGHIVLHTEELIKTDGRGSYLLNSPEKETEADIFSDRILELKKEFYEKVCSEKRYH